jgi:hypothetical protein
MRKRLILRRLMFLLATLLGLWSRESIADTIDVVRSTRDAIVNTAVVVEGRVTDITYTYDAAEGPRTVATLSDVTTHFGSFDESTLRIATLGGPISPTRWAFVPELPRLTKETRYLLFLTNVDWFYTPVVGEYIFQLELNSQGTDVLIGPSGHAVVGVNEGELSYTPAPVLDNQFDFLTPARQAAGARERTHTAYGGHAEGGLRRHPPEPPPDHTAQRRVSTTSVHRARLEPGDCRVRPCER